jgi:hypothetical protein
VPAGAPGWSSASAADVDHFDVGVGVELGET